MVRKLTKHGNSLVLELEPGVLDLLNIDEETLLEISTDGKILFIAPIKDREWRKAFQEALEAANAQYRHALKNLAE